jgi:hypothetical protein
MDVKTKMFIVSSFLNLIDLMTSFIDFSIGYTETNHWMLMFHDKYMSALMGVITFELILIVWYVFSKKYDIMKYGMLTWGLTKLYPIINNVLLLIFSF